MTVHDERSVPSEALKDRRIAPEGKINLRVLWQRELWQTGDGRLLTVEGMAPSHRVNVLGYLRKNAARFLFPGTLAQELSLTEVFRPVLGELDGKPIFDRRTVVVVPPDEVLDEIDQEFVKALDDPVAWMRGTPIYQRIRELVLADGLDPGDEES